jgi:hypothetical protein
MEELNLKEGETMAIEDIDVIYEKAMEEFRSKENFQYQTRYYLTIILLILLLI